MPMIYLSRVAHRHKSNDFFFLTRWKGKCSSSMTYAHRLDFSRTGALPWVPLRTFRLSIYREMCPFLITYFDIFVSCLLSSFFSYTPIDRCTLFCLAQDMKIIIRWFDFSSLSLQHHMLVPGKAMEIDLTIVLSSHVQTCCVLNIQLTFTNGH